MNSIQYDAFYGSKINSIIIPSSVEHIGHRAFANCTELSNIIIPGSVKFINNGAFSGCTGLTYVYIHPNTHFFLDRTEKWCFFDGCTNFYPFQRPNDATINITQNVVDTLKAEKMFEEIKSNLIATYQEIEARQQRCEELYEMIGKKTKNEKDLDILSYAYFLYCQKYNFSDYINEKDKNVKKGKITSDVQNYLFGYKLFLTDSLRKIKEKIDKGWSKCVNKDKLSYKKISVSMPNAFYRGRRYKYDNEMDSMDIYQQRNGWEFLYTKDYKKYSDSYPVKVNYLVFDAAPDYKVTYSEYGIKNVFDKQGQLVYVPSLTRSNNWQEIKDVRRLVYFKDFINNKYNIHSQSEKTQDYIINKLSKNHDSDIDAFSLMIASTFASAMADELLPPLDAYKAKKRAKEYVLNNLPTIDEDGDNYISQLKKDHAKEFEYVYMIERISNVSFRIIYLNEQTLEPSYCAVITYQTGDKPYTVNFSTKLEKLPKDIPPVIRK